jgi:hypothetical protein
VLTSGGTPDEASAIRSVTDRLRTKAADATFARDLGDATARRDYKTAGKLVADAIGVKVGEIVMTLSSSVGSARLPQTPFRLASNSARLNPWYIVFSMGGRVYCASTSASTCVSALNKMGYKDTKQIW